MYIVAYEYKMHEKIPSSFFFRFHNFFLRFFPILLTLYFRILLNHFKWDKEKLMEKYFSENQEAMFDEAHVISPYRYIRDILLVHIAVQIVHQHYLITTIFLPPPAITYLHIFPTVIVWIDSRIIRDR